MILKGLKKRKKSDCMLYAVLIYTSHTSNFCCDSCFICYSETCSLIMFHGLSMLSFKLPKISFSTIALSILLTTQEAFVDSVSQDQTPQNVLSDLGSTMSTFSFKIVTKLSSSCNGSVFLVDEKSRIYLFGSEN